MRLVLPHAWFVPLVAVAGFPIERMMHPSQTWLGIMVATQVALLFWSVSGPLIAPQRLLIAAFSGGGTSIVLTNGHLSATNAGIAIGGLCHLSAYATLLTWFALSLRSGCEPVVTSFARQMRKSMPIKVVHYTRAVTWAWCALFAAQIGVSFLLLIVKAYDAWSAFVSVWSWLLVAIMALGEYGTRSLLFPRNERTDFLTTLAELRKVRLFPVRPR